MIYRHQAQKAYASWQELIKSRDWRVLIGVIGAHALVALFVLLAAVNQVLPNKLPEPEITIELASSKAGNEQPTQEAVEKSPVPAKQETKEDPEKGQSLSVSKNQHAKQKVVVKQEQQPVFEKEKVVAESPPVVQEVPAKPEPKEQPKEQPKVAAHKLPEQDAPKDKDKDAPVVAPAQAAATNVASAAVSATVSSGAAASGGSSARGGVPAESSVSSASSGSSNPPAVDADYKAAHLNNEKPPYPPAAFRLKIQGNLVLAVEVLEDGSAGFVKLLITSGNESLDKSAMETVKKWRFVPAKKDGAIFRQIIRVPISFKLVDR